MPKEDTLEDTLLKKENHAEELEKTYRGLVGNDRNREEIAKELAHEYYEIMKILNSKEKAAEIDIKKWGYLAQALKFGSIESIDHFVGFAVINCGKSLENLTSTMLVNTFLLSLDNADPTLKNLRQPVYDKIFTTLERVKNNPSILQLVNFFREQLPIFEKSNSMTFRENLTQLLLSKLKSRANDFKLLKLEAVQIFQLIKFFEERKFVSQYCLSAYAHYFSGLAEKYPHEYAALSCKEEIDNFVSNHRVANNKVWQSNVSNNFSFTKKIGSFVSEKTDEAAGFFRNFWCSGPADEHHRLLEPKRDTSRSYINSDLEVDRDEFNETKKQR